MGDRRFPRRRGAALISLAVLLACGVYAVPASAFVTKAAKTITVPAFSAAAVSPTCPDTEYAAFGGVVSQFSGPITATNRHARMVLTPSMHRLGTDPRVLKANAVNPLLGASYTALAYCEAGPIPTVVSKTRPLSGSSAATAVATCPAGTVAVGGGYASGSGPKNTAYVGALALTTPTRLFVAMVNIADVQTTVTALVDCAPGPAPTPHETAQTVGGHKVATATVNCPSTSALAFGGLAVTPPSGSESKFSAVIPLSWHATSPTQWRVTAYNYGTKSGTVYAEAYCR